MVAAPSGLTVIDVRAYNSLVKLCPDLPQLKEDEYRVLTAKSKNATEVIIGCRKAETDQYAGVYEIKTKDKDTLIVATVEVSHTDQTASAMLFERFKEYQKKTVETPTEGRLQNLLSDLERKGYKSPNINQQPQRG